MDDEQSGLEARFR